MRCMMPSLLHFFLKRRSAFSKGSSGLTRTFVTRSNLPSIIKYYYDENLVFARFDPMFSSARPSGIDRQLTPQGEIVPYCPSANQFHDRDQRVKGEGGVGESKISNFTTHTPYPKFQTLSMQPQAGILEKLGYVYPDKQGGPQPELRPCIFTRRRFQPRVILEARDWRPRPPRKEKRHMWR
mgnify:CR=1 FL=1